MTSAGQARSLGADFEISPGSTTENLAPFVPSNYFVAHVKLHNVIWNWSFSCHASTITLFSFLFPPVDFHNTDRQESREERRGRKRKKKILFNSPSVWGHRNALS